MDEPYSSGPDVFHHSMGADDVFSYNVEILRCRTCGASEFVVGQDWNSYLTAIKCPKCGWTAAIHQG